MTKPIFSLIHRPLNNFASVRVSEEMGYRKEHPTTGKPSRHKGIDLVPSNDLRVFATHNGTVTEVGYQFDEVKNSGWGYYIEIVDGSGFKTKYAHFAEPSPLKKNAPIKAGDQIGIAGRSGGASGVHLHLEIIDDNKAFQNPRPYLAEAFSEFSTIVDAGGLEGQIIGDFRDNLIIGNTRQNTLKGLAGTDTYYFQTLDGSDVIDDVDLDGKIVIGNGKQSVALSGNALPKTDTDGNAIDGVWTLSGFDFHKIGSDLVIVKAAADVAKDGVGKVTVKNFPFENSRGSFGITLGKTADLVVDPNTGDVVSTIGYDSFTKNLPDQFTTYSDRFLKTSNGFFGIVKMVDASNDNRYFIAVHRV